jgi:hypothetical protein
MSTFTRDQAIALLIDAFPQLPLPKVSDEGFFYSSAPAFDWLSVKNRLWTDVSSYTPEKFEGFRFIATLIPDKYYFYYLPAAWVAVFDNPEFIEIIHRSLLPTHYHKLDQRWQNHVSILNPTQINTLISFLKKCKSAFDFYENVMEIDILIEALEKH